MLFLTLQIIFLISTLEFSSKRTKKNPMYFLCYANSALNFFFYSLAKGVNHGQRVQMMEKWGNSINLNTSMFSWVYSIQFSSSYMSPSCGTTGHDWMQFNQRAKYSCSLRILWHSHCNCFFIKVTWIIVSRSSTQELNSKHQHNKNSLQVSAFSHLAKNS